MLTSCILSSNDWLISWFRMILCFFGDGDGDSRSSFASLKVVIERFVWEAQDESVTLHWVSPVYLDPSKE